MFTRMISRWKENWKREHLGARLYEIFQESLDALIWTMFLCGGAGAVMVVYFGLPLQAVLFLAIVYTLLLAIYISKLFTQDRIAFKLDQILMDLDHHDQNTASPCLDELRKDIEELTLRIGQ